MEKHNKALTTYIDLIEYMHKLASDNFDFILSLPSYECTQFSQITKSQDSLLNVYFMNGYIKYKFLKFYELYACQVYEVGSQYITKHGLNYLNFEPHLLELKTDADLYRDKMAINNANLNDIQLDREQVGRSISNMFKAIDIMVEMDDKVHNFIVMDDLDVNKQSMFKFFFKNELYVRTNILLNDFPKGNLLNSCKIEYADALNTLIHI